MAARRRILLECWSSAKSVNSESQRNAGTIDLALFVLLVVPLKSVEEAPSETDPGVVVTTVAASRGELAASTSARAFCVNLQPPKASRPDTVRCHYRGRGGISDVCKLPLEHGMRIITTRGVPIMLQSDRQGSMDVR